MKHVRKEKIKLGTQTKKDIQNKHQIKKKGKDVLQIQTKEVQRKKSTKIEKIKSITDEFDKTYNSTLSQITTNSLSDLESHIKVPGNVHINHTKFECN